MSRIAGSWHFDESDPGGRRRRLDAAARSARRPVPGFVRNGVLLTPVVAGARGRASTARRPTIRASDSRSKCRSSPGLPGTIARFGRDTGDSGSFLLRLNDDGSLAADATVRTENATLSVQTRPKVIEMGQWAKVAIAHDGVELTIAAHNVIEARDARPARARGRPGRLRSSSAAFSAAPSTRWSTGPSATSIRSKSTGRST